MVHEFGGRRSFLDRLACRIGFHDWDYKGTIKQILPGNRGEIFIRNRTCRACCLKQEMICNKWVCK